MSLGTVLRAVGIHWNNTTILRDAGLWLVSHECPFELSPEYFLLAARRDLKWGGLGGLANALTNAKKAIDCEADSFLDSLGIKPCTKVPPNVTDYLARQGRSGYHDEGVNWVLALLRALDVVPAGLAGRVRHRRNLLEHQYEGPDLQDAREAVEVADLFRRAVRYAKSRAPDALYITSDDVAGMSQSFPPNRAALIYQDGSIAAAAYVHGESVDQAAIAANDPGYLELVRLAIAIAIDGEFQDALYEVLFSCGLDIPRSALR